jgi:hypothetical protein
MVTGYEEFCERKIAGCEGQPNQVAKLIKLLDGSCPIYSNRLRYFFLKYV